MSLLILQILAVLMAGPVWGQQESQESGDEFSVKTLDDPRISIVFAAPEELPGDRPQGLWETPLPEDYVETELPIFDANQEEARAEFWETDTEY